MIRRLFGSVYAWMGLAFIAYACVRVFLELGSRLPHDPSSTLVTLTLFLLGGALIFIAYRQVRP